MRKIFNLDLIHVASDICSTKIPSIVIKDSLLLAA